MVEYLSAKAFPNDFPICLLVYAPNAFCGQWLQLRNVLLLYRCAGCAGWGPPRQEPTKTSWGCDCPGSPMTTAVLRAGHIKPPPNQLTPGAVCSCMRPCGRRCRHDSRRRRRTWTRASPRCAAPAPRSSRTQRLKTTPSDNTSGPPISNDSCLK
jgi:hypothetical protein